MKFKDIEIDECFRWNGTVYKKTDPSSAVHTNTYQRWLIPWSTDVEPLCAVHTDGRCQNYGNPRVTEQQPPKPNDKPAIWDLGSGDRQDRGGVEAGADVGHHRGHREREARMTDTNIQEHFERLFKQATDAGADTDWFEPRDTDWWWDPWASSPDAIDQISSLLARREYKTALDLLESAGDDRFTPAREFVRGLVAGWKIRWEMIKEEQEP